MKKSRIQKDLSEELKTLVAELLVAELLSVYANPILYFPGTVLARCLIFPVIVKGQREAAKIHNHSPEIQRFSARIREAKLAGDSAECKSSAG